ncbi:MAG: hypothetical protein AABY30_01505, partial [Candidatus Thermoplasmatota archaeon]
GTRNTEKTRNPCGAEGIRPDRVQVVNATALVAKVSRDAFAAALDRPGRIEVCVTGALSDGRTFRACDTIRVISPGR